MTEQHIDIAARRPGQPRGVCGWHSIHTAPLDQDLELAVIDHEGPHALVFPCRKTDSGWIDARTETRVQVRPTHWREWRHLIYN
jgi:hypothetical protein